jgi:hypothetical protein
MCVALVFLSVSLPLHPSLNLHDLMVNLAGAAEQLPRPCFAPSPMALPQCRNFSTNTTGPTVSMDPTNPPKSTAPRNKTASKSRKRAKPNYFDMKRFLANGTAERPWYQLLMGGREQSAASGEYQ